MTRIQIFRDGNEFRIRAEGHATGSAAACAGVSALLYALAGWLKNEYSALSREGTRSEGAGARSPEAGPPWLRAELREGYAELRFRGGDRAAAAYDLTVIGLAQLAEWHPEMVSVEVSPSPLGEKGRKHRSLR